MLARWIRAAQLLELLACLSAAAWLRAAHGWSLPAIVVGVAAWFAGVRLLLVVVSMLLGWAFRSPRPPEQRIGFAGVPRLVFGEWRAFLAFNLLHLPWENLVLRPDAAPRPMDRLPVLLVHGYFANRGCFSALVRRLEAAGAGPVFVPDFRSWFAPIETFEEQLHAQIPELSPEAAAYFEQATERMRAGRAADALRPMLVLANFLRATGVYQAGVMALEGPGGVLVGFPIVTLSQPIAGQQTQ